MKQRIRRRIPLRIVNKTRSPPPKPQTGGNSNGNDDGGNGNGNDKHLEKIRDYNVGVLQRCFDPQPEITENALISAMLKRWGRPYKLRVTVPNNSALIAINFMPQQYNPNRSDEKNALAKEELLVALSILNTFGLAGQFVDYIKYDTSLRDPGHSWTGSPITVSINVPISGGRLCEWMEDHTI